MKKFLLITFIVFFLSSCADAFKDEITVMIISKDGDFTGWYTIDSGDFQSITAANSYSNPYYFYRSTVEFTKSITVSATPNKDASGDVISTSIEISLSIDGEEVVSNSDSDSSVEAIKVSYTKTSSSD